VTYEEIAQAAAELEERNRGLNEPNNRLSVEERYRRDPVFRTLVDMMHAHLHQWTSYTPTELREAVILAATMHETRCVLPNDRFTWDPNRGLIEKLEADQKLVRER